MNHRALLASLTDEQRRNLTARSNRPALIHAAIHFGLIVAIGAMIAARIPYWPLLMVPQGVLIVFLFTVEHETAHETAFSTPALNIWISRICGFLVFVPAIWFRYFHLAHHRHTQDPDHDPELEGGKPETRMQYIWHVSGIPLWWSMLKTLYVNASGTIQAAYIPQKAIAKVRREARALLVLYGAVLAISIVDGSLLLLTVWITPILIGQPFLRLYLLAEHGRCPLVANMLENSRTTYTTRIVRWLAWNMPYHAEHHALPTVPFHQLPNLHILTKPHLLTTSDGYIEFHRDYVAELGK